MSGVSTRTIQRVEAGEAPSAETVLALAAAFNLTPSDMYPERFEPGLSPPEEPLKPYTEELAAAQIQINQILSRLAKSLFEEGMPPTPSIRIPLRMRLEFDYSHTEWDPEHKSLELVSDHHSIYESRHIRVRECRTGFDVGPSVMCVLTIEDSTQDA